MHDYQKQGTLHAPKTAIASTSFSFSVTISYSSCLYWIAFALHDKVFIIQLFHVALVN